MKKITGILSTLLVVAALAVGLRQLPAQEPEQPTFRVKVDMVVLSFTVLDQKNKYVNGLKPKDFKIYEDDIQEKPATFAEGSRSPMQVLDNGDLRACRGFLATARTRTRATHLPRQGRYGRARFHCSRPEE